MLKRKKGPHIIFVKKIGKNTQNSEKYSGRIRKIQKNTENFKKYSENPQKYL